MGEYNAFILQKIQEDRFNPSDAKEGTILSMRTLRRFHLNECVKHIYSTKGIRMHTRFDADEESIPRLRQCVDQVLKDSIQPESPVERVRRKLFHASRNRKSSHPKKCQGKKDNFIFKAKNRSSRMKVPRDYLSMGRPNVIRDLVVEGYKFYQIQNHFYYNAREKLRDVCRCSPPSTTSFIKSETLS